MPTKTLQQIFAHRTGKVSDKWSLYLTEYDRLFLPMMEDPVRLLEIGVQNGGSLEGWSQYFSNAQAIIGCDINPDCQLLTFEDPRIEIIVGDANLLDIQTQILERSPQFDIIIDDGSHMSSDIIKSFVLYFPQLVADGMFVAEDLHCSYWGMFEGGLYNPNSSMAFFKRLADVINREHWGIEKSRADALSGIFNQYGCRLDERSLAQVHSIEFLNSMCVIRKSGELTTLGHRVISGKLERVQTGHIDQDGRAYALDPLFDETANVWSNRQISPAEELAMIGRLLGQEVPPSFDVLDQVSQLQQREAALLLSLSKVENDVVQLRQREVALLKILADVKGDASQLRQLKALLLNKPGDVEACG